MSVNAEAADRHLHMRCANSSLKATLPQMQRPWPLVPAQGMAKPPKRHARTHRKEVIDMTVSIQLWILVGAVVYVAWRYMGLRIWQLLACVAFGVLLAATSAGPEINNFLNGLVHWLTKP